MTRTPSGDDERGAGPILELQDLSVAFGTDKQRVTVVHSASLSVGPAQMVGLVGESGSGKTVTAMASIGLVRLLGGAIVDGRVTLEGRDVTALSEKSWRRLRGSVIATVFQNPMRSLNPAFTVGAQIAEIVRYHRGLTHREAWRRAVEMLDRVHIPRAAVRAHDYPHQFSGGMCQRVAIAMALVCGPKLLIADEPTTALDVTIQRHILELLLELRAADGIAVLLITHDLGVVAQTCDRVAVMYAGEVVERGDVVSVFRAPVHPYTQGLLAALPRPGAGRMPIAIPGQVPPPDEVIPGCRFAARCADVRDPVCTSTPLSLRAVGVDRWTRCIRAEELAAEGT